jgi:hypothetical protein
MVSSKCGVTRLRLALGLPRTMPAVAGSTQVGNEEPTVRYGGLEPIWTIE